ncbi:hypothetical protein ACLIIZ_15415 [Azonexus caeni]|uniref:hypothetical protein n=1 Tax=Azonexus caeni TaxID=266126 RepID=UPI003A843F68
MNDWFIVPPPPAIVPTSVGKIAPIYWTPIPGSGERICIAIISYDDAGHALGNALPRLRCLGEMGDSFAYFGALLVDDFKQHIGKGGIPDTWKPRLGGMNIGEWRIAHGENLAVSTSAYFEAFSALWKSNPDTEPESPQPLVVPRNKELKRFIQTIKIRVESVNKDLIQLFEMHYGLADLRDRVKPTVDYLSSRYAACYAVLNPKSNNARLYANDSLWRLARARDAQLIPPNITEAVLWVPDPELPMFSEEDIAAANEHVEELQAEAKREGITVATVHSAEVAAKRLIAAESL